MNSKLLVVLVIISAASAKKKTPGTWSYREDDGPDTWCDFESKCCGLRQSPINIDTEDAKKSKEEIEVNDSNSEDYNVELENTGSTIRATLTNVKRSKAPSIEMPKLPFFRKAQTYILDHVDLRWGTKNNKGTEHKIDKTGYAAEMQFVFYAKSKKSFSSALNARTGIVIVSRLFEVDKSDHDSLDKITQYLSKVDNLEETTTIKDATNLETALKDIADCAYVYRGSFTSPEFDCAQNVVWVVAPDTLPISKKTIKRLRASFSSREKEEDVPLDTNVRPTQDLNDRSVLKMGCKKKK